MIASLTSYVEHPDAIPPEFTEALVVTLIGDPNYRGSMALHRTNLAPAGYFSAQEGRHITTLLELGCHIHCTVEPDYMLEMHDKVPFGMWEVVAFRVQWHAFVPYASYD